MAFSTVIVHLAVATFEPVLLVFITFLIAEIALLLTARNRYKKISALIRQHCRLIILINISTAINWLIVFIALKYLTSAIVNSIDFAVAPLAIFILSFFVQPHQSKVLYKFFLSLLILLILFGLTIFYYQFQSQHYNIVIILTMLFLLIIGGLAGGVTVFCCKQLSQSKFSNRDIISIRFIGLLIITFLILIVNNATFSLSIPLFALGGLLAITLVMIPALLLQKAIAQCTPFYITMMATLIPIFTYGFELLLTSYPFNFIEFSLITLLTVVIIIYERLEFGN